MEGSFEKPRELTDKLDIIITNGCPAHFHSKLELLVVRKGAVQATVNGVSSRLVEGQAAIADSCAVHIWTPEPGAEGVVLIIPTQYQTEYAAVMKGRTFADPILRDETIGRGILTMLELLQIDRPESLVTRGLLNAILGTFIENLPLKERETADQLMRDVLLYISDNFTEPLTLAGLSKKYGYTPSHFSRIFSAYTGDHIPDYLGALRAERAAALLRSGQPVTEAAADAGFQSMRTFYRIFMQTYNRTPKEYLKTVYG